MKQGWKIITWIAIIVSLVLFIDLAIYSWSHIDMTYQRQFINNWEKNVICLIFLIVARIGMYKTYDV